MLTAVKQFYVRDFEICIAFDAYILFSGMMLVC